MVILNERIPTYIVEMLDASDQLGVNTFVPTRFNWSLIQVKYSVSVNGKIFEYKQ